MMRSASCAVSKPARACRDARCSRWQFDAPPQVLRKAGVLSTFNTAKELRPGEAVLLKGARRRGCQSQPTAAPMPSPRVQSVTRDQNERYYDLIKNFAAKTGVAAVLNTSFNLKGEPIVNSPFDAIRTFYTSGLDALFLDRYLISKIPPSN
jgi:hypothetical protein